MDVGVRVVRGPDWKWGDQDGGEGFVGTVIDIGKRGSESSPNQTVVVQWDLGFRTNYRIGYQNAYDLRVWDNSPLGIKHQNIKCDYCKKQGIAGIRWKCSSCTDFDLCTLCYMDDRHDTSHSFVRFQMQNSPGVPVPPRAQSKKQPLKGIFVGARVIRGPDWDWGNQDGGEGKVGRVLEIRGWENETCLSVASVTWPSGETNIYRVGHKGKVDLKCLSEAIGAYYYSDHLAVFGKMEELPALGTTGTPPPIVTVPAPAVSALVVGDRVQIGVDVATLKQLQEGHGGWNQRMVECIGKVGTVHRVTEKGDIRVTYDHCSNRWTLNPGSLVKITSFIVGDRVRVMEDVQRMKEFQKGHGEWVDAMKKALGKVGEVVKVYADGDVRVAIDNQPWTFNPLCLSFVSGHNQESHNMAGTLQNRDSINPQMDRVRQAPEFHSNEVDILVHNAAQGRVPKVKEIIASNPEKINETGNGKTALQVAAHEGHVEVVKALLQANASTEVQDAEGDTALHYAVFGDKPAVMELLLMKGANIDAVNKGKCTPLHIAVNKQHVACVKMLIKFSCSLNLQDSFGDTPLHDAICRKNNEIVDLLISCPGVDLFVKNSRGFNILHHAALKGNTYAAEKIISKSRQLVEIPKDDGFSALHLSSINNHKSVAELLLVQGMADPNLPNLKGQTSLHLAVSQLHPSICELLISHGANVNQEDEEGNTSLHYALRKHVSHNGDVEQEESPAVYRIWCDLRDQGRPQALGLALACYLVDRGASLDKKNKAKKSPIEHVTDQAVGVILESFCRKSPVASTSQSGPQPSTSAMDDCATLLGDNLKVEVGDEATEEMLSECIVCCELCEPVRFEPCGHRIACVECGKRMKKCLGCKEYIVDRVTGEGISLSSASNPRTSERLTYLERRVAEMEEATSCPICLEKKKNVAFMCGHGACESCAQTLKTCHMCRKPILKKITLF